MPSPALSAEPARPDGLTAPQQMVSTALHPLVYKAMVGFALWLVLAAWGFFTDQGYIKLVLFVVTGFIGISIALPSICARIWRNGRERLEHREPSGPGSFLTWTAGELETCTSRLKCSAAAVEILLPVAAVALGMTAFAIVRDIVVS